MRKIATRARKEKFIRDMDTAAGREFDRALDRVIGQHGGLSFFTDEQIAEITSEMARKERWSHSLMIRNRRAAWDRGRAA